MGQTIFQMLKARLRRPAKARPYNPLNLKFDSRVTINALDLRDHEYRVQSLRANERTIEGAAYNFIDYEVIGTPRPGNAGERKHVRLRATPLEVPDAASGMTDSYLVLSLYYECGYTEAKESGLLDAVHAGTGEFEIDWEGKRKYYRIQQGLTTPYQVSVRVWEDARGSRPDDATVTENLELWDYHTELRDEAGKAFTEYLFVERNEKTGWVQLWRGSAVNPEQITSL